MINVICDTNVWYNLGNNSSIISCIPEYNFFATCINVMELKHSPYFLADKKIIFNAIKILISNGNIINENPYDYYLKYNNKPFLDSNSLCDVLSEFNRIASLTNSDDLVLNNKLIEINNAKYVNCKNDLSNEFNTKLENIKINIKKLFGKKEHRKQLTISLIQELFQELINDYLDSIYIESNLNYDEASKCELFLNTFDAYIKEIELCPSRKIKSNDWNDYFNLIYVRKGDLYWTFDEDVKEFVKKSGMEHYLYIPD